MRKKTLVSVCLSLLFVFVAAVSGWAQLTAEEIARLGKDLTPMGGLMAGNSDGTIPAWEGGLTSAPAGFKTGDKYPDPYAADKVLFTITAANMDQYQDKLTAGQKALLKKYESFKMNIYPTRRSAAVPQRVYEGTRKLAAVAKLAKGGSGIVGGVGGIPFPIPKNGMEVMNNAGLRYKGDYLTYKYIQAPVNRAGNYTLGKDYVISRYSYWLPGMTEKKLDNTFFLYLGEIQAPAKISGRFTLVQDPLDWSKGGRRAWTYNPGQRRVRRAPSIAFDNPRQGADGLMTTDMLGMFNGSLERYDWKLVGKKEFYIPYNAYRLQNAPKYTDILKPFHINPDLLRYELHRVWVVDATLKEGFRHLYKRRTFYVDEDSWMIVSADLYDNRDNLWRVSESHTMIYTEVPVLYSAGEVHMDLQAGRYFAIYFSNEGKGPDFTTEVPAKKFTPSALRRAGRR